MNFLIFAALLGITVCDEVAPAVDWKKRAQEATWEWPDRDQSLFRSTMNTNEPYQVILEHIRDERFIVRISRNDNLRLKFSAHNLTVFDRCREKFIYTQFNSSASGCTIVAYDLEAKKQLWSTPLEGIGPIAHFIYSNRVALSIVYGVIHVHGWEAGGKYVEYLDLNSGKVLGHRVFEKGFK